MEFLFRRALSKAKSCLRLFSLLRRKPSKAVMTRTSLPSKVRFIRVVFLCSLRYHNPAANLIGQELYDKVSEASLKLYTTAADYAYSRGVILADTKFEFGLVPSSTGTSKTLILIDELLTPDSSRYWPLSGYTPGGAQPSFDKQYLRDWLVSTGFKKGLESGPEGKEGQGWIIEENVVNGTRDRYKEAVDLLTKE